MSCVFIRLDRRTEPTAFVARVLRLLEASVSKRGDRVARRHPAERGVTDHRAGHDSLSDG